MNHEYLSIIEQDGLSALQINHPLFTAQISEYGGQILSFTPANRENILWLSDSALMDGSKPIRGGIPLCWPWFGPAPLKFANEPQHGYIRNLNWQLDNYEENEKEVILTISPKIPAELTHKLKLSVFAVYRFSDKLTIELHTTNQGDEPFELTSAIHTYFDVSNIKQTQINELQGCEYIDKLTNKSEIQSEPLVVDQHMDRVYLYENKSLTIATLNNDILLEHSGHDSVVIWNPWQQLAKEMADFDNEGFNTMLCVEAAVTQGIFLYPQKTHVLTQTICA